MLTLEKRLAVVNLYEELGSYRAVAELVGCDHKTVKAWMERERCDGTSRIRRMRATDPYLELMRAKVEASGGRIKSRPLLRVLRAVGYTESLRTLQRGLREIRREWSLENRRAYRPWVSAPGDFLMVDWGEVGRVMTAAGERRLYSFCAVLGWSRWRYVRFYTCQRSQVLAQGLAGCFEEHMGGVPAHVLFDNARTVTSGFVAGAAVLNPELVRLAAHYRFRPLTTAPSDPQSKGKVEALVRYLKANLPVEGFASLLEANRWAPKWCGEVNAEPHSETRQAPIERMERERQLLKRLPEKAALAAGEVRKVDRMSTIRFGAARYSAPFELGAEEVEVLVEGTELRILHRGAEVALHCLQPPGGASIQEQHYPSPAPTGLRPLRPTHPTEIAFLKLGPPAESYLRAAAAAGTPRLQQQLARVLELAEIYGQAATQAALERAVQFARFRWNDLHSILTAAGSAPPSELGRPLPMPAAMELPKVPQRQMASYRWTG